MSAVSSESRGWPNPQSAMPAMGRTTTVPSGLGHEPTRGEESQGQNVASSATQSVGWESALATGGATVYLAATTSISTQQPSRASPFTSISVLTGFVAAK